MEEAEPKGKSAAFKLSTLETIAADPLMKPIDHSLLCAYMKFMKWPARTAYLTNLKARILTNAKSERTISTSRARLVKHKYLNLVMTKLNGAAIYEINNPRAEIVADHIAIAEEKLKEMDSFRKSKERRRRSLRVRGVAEIAAPNKPGGSKECRDSPAIFADNSLEYSLKGRAPKEGTEFSYAAQSKGA